MVWFTDPEPFDTGALADMVRASCGGEMHDAIRGYGVWRSGDDKAMARKRLAELQREYDRSPGNVDDPEWGEIAELLSMPPDARFARIRYPTAGVTYDAYVARSSYFGVHVVTDDGVTHVRTFRPKRERMSEALVGAIAEWVRYSPDGPISITRSQLDKAGGMGMREPSPQVTRLRELMRLPAYLTAEFYAECRTMRERDVRRTRHPLYLHALGTEQHDAGAWAMRVLPRGNDHEILLASVDAAGLADTLDQLRTELG